MAIFGWICFVLLMLYSTSAFVVGTIMHDVFSGIGFVGKIIVAILGGLVIYGWYVLIQTAPFSFIG